MHPSNLCAHSPTGELACSLQVSANPTTDPNSSKWPCLRSCCWSCLLVEWPTVRRNSIGISTIGLSGTNFNVSVCLPQHNLPKLDRTEQGKEVHVELMEVWFYRSTLHHQVLSHPMDVVFRYQAVGLISLHKHTLDLKEQFLGRMYTCTFSWRLADDRLLNKKCILSWTSSGGGAFSDCWSAATRSVSMFVLLMEGCCNINPRHQ